MTADIESIYSFHQLGERENQEDARFPDTDNPDSNTAVFAVCDGVGGCDKGEVASSTVCRQVGEFMSGHRNTDEFNNEDFKNLLASAYRALDRVSDSSNKIMATTLAFLAFHSNGVLAAHIGDSRIYQIRPGEGIIYRSEDHSLVNALLRSGNISPDEIKNHPKANVITRCMVASDGNREQDAATVLNLRDIAPDDYFLLCTDGVTSQIEEEELMELYYSERNDIEKYKYLAAKCEHSSDNNTAIQIHIGLVTIDHEVIPEDKSSEDKSSKENVDSSRTQKLLKKDDSVQDVSAAKDNLPTKLKNLFIRLFQ